MVREDNFNEFHSSNLYYYEVPLQRSLPLNSDGRIIDRSIGTSAEDISRRRLSFATLPLLASACYS